MTNQVHVRLGIILGIILLFLVLLLVLHVPSTFGAVKRSETPPRAPSGSLPVTNLQTSRNDPINNCVGKPEATSRAGCLFQDLANLLQDQQEWNDWTSVPINGLAGLNCSVPAINKLPQSFLNNFIALAQLSNRRAEAKINRPRGVRGSTISTGGFRGDSSPNVSSISGSGIFFNKNARNYLCRLGQIGNNSWISAVLTQKTTATPQQPIDLQPTPIVFVKPLWYLVPIDPGNESVPVWDADHSLSGTIVPNLQNWNTVVSINDADNVPCNFKYTGWNGPNPSISIGCFFSIKLNPDQCEQAAKQSGTVEGEPQALDVGPAGCHLILMAINLSAKTREGWTWQTYWWSSRAEDPSSPDSKLRIAPNSSDNRWRFYVMDTADFHRLYNPYLEGTLVGGTKTDCSECHKKAEFHSVSPQNEPLLSCLFNHTSSATAWPTHCNIVGETVQSLTTDSVWSLADVNVPLKSRENSSR